MYKLDINLPTFKYLIIMMYTLKNYYFVNIE